VIDQNRERVEALRAAGVHAVSGDASDPATLVQAHIANAGLLVVATPDSTDARPMIETARNLNADIPVIARAANAEEALLLLSEGARTAVYSKGALADAMVRDVLDAIKPGDAAVLERPAH
jgi:CPA2 family monovalent cation:H+ antiporter-2